MTSISVYGYDPQMLAAVNAQSIVQKVQEQSEEPLEAAISCPVQKIRTECYLLNLPYELRSQIYRYTMPATILTPMGIVWLRATAPIWATCRIIYRECIGMIYSDCWFDINVTYEKPTFGYQWSTPKAGFPKWFTLANLSFLKSFL